MLLLASTLNTLFGNEDYRPDLVSNLSNKQLRNLVSYHTLILDNYKNLRTLLFKQNSKYQIELYLTALFLAELLIKLYWYHVDLKKDIPALIKQQAHYRVALNALNYSIKLIPAHSRYLPTSITEDIREHNSFVNYLRLCVVRAKKLLSTISLLLNKVEFLKYIVKYLEFFTPLFNYLSWIAFLPRLFCNIYDLFLRVVPGFWMSPRDAKRQWWKRFQTQFMLHWFEWANDLPWCIGGILGCFLLIGGLSTIGTYLTIALFGYDIVLAGIRSTMALIDLYLLKEQYECSEFFASINQKQAQINTLYVAAIDQHIHYQQLRAFLSIGNTVALFLAVSLTIPAIIACNPIIVPIISAALILGLTIGVHYLGVWLEKCAPPVETISEIPVHKKISELGAWGFFEKKDPVQKEDFYLEYAIAIK